MRLHIIVTASMTSAIILFGSHCYSTDAKSEPIRKTPEMVFSEMRMEKIFRQNAILNEARLLARQGMYDEAIKKYELAMDPSVINSKFDMAYSLCSICDIYKYQGRLDEALDLFQKQILPLNPKKQSYIEKGLELKSLIMARDTKSNKPIYGYINYIKIRYEKYLPPKAYAITYEIKIDKLIHLYDYLHDYDAGVSFMNEVIRYLLNNGGDLKTLKDYARVKRAWQLDKETGQHGHLQDVIRTSDIISW